MADKSGRSPSQVVICVIHNTILINFDQMFTLCGGHTHICKWKSFRVGLTLASHSSVPNRLDCGVAGREGPKKEEGRWLMLWSRRAALIPMDSEPARFRKESVWVCPDWDALEKDGLGCELLLMSKLRSYRRFVNHWLNSKTRCWNVKNTIVLSVDSISARHQWFWFSGCIGFLIYENSVHRIKIPEDLISICKQNHW